MRLILAVLVIAIAAPVAADEAGHAGFVRLGEVAPTIRQDIRYARPFNFTGDVVPGYERPACLLTDDAADALIGAEATLNAQGLALVVFDCYRPASSVESFVAWVNGDGADRLYDVFVPDVPRSELIERGYIADRSSHARGSTVDVGLVRIDDPPFRPTEAGRCDGDLATRARESSLDLGTAYDCFSPQSGVDADLTDAARATRRILFDAMTAAGFGSYDPEWWHYTLADETYPDTFFDFPVN